MKKVFLIPAIVFAILMFQSCLSPKKLYYFHDQQVTKQSLDTINQQAKLKIYKGDRLQIVVTSPDPLISGFLNPYAVSNTNINQQVSTGYLVNESGKINFPQIGEIEVDSLTTSVVAKMLNEKLSFFYKDIFVDVSLLGKVFFMSGRTGTAISLNNERLTIFEAMAQSGIQDPYDVKDKVWLVREENGERVFAQLNLNSKDIFLSPYYYLHNNDLIYVKPGQLSTLLAPSSPVKNILTIGAALLTFFIIFRR